MNLALDIESLLHLRQLKAHTYLLMAHPNGLDEEVYDGGHGDEERRPFIDCQIG